MTQDCEAWVQKYYVSCLPDLRIMAYNLAAKYWDWRYTLAGQSFCMIVDLPLGNDNIAAKDENSTDSDHADHSQLLVRVE